MIKHLTYILASQWYTVRFVIYVIHSALVFLTKPGARIIVPVALFGLFYALRAPLRALVGGEVDAMWASLAPPFLGRDLAEMAEPYRLEISAVLALVCVVIVFLLIASMLRPVMGAFWAPKRPLPPLAPLDVPDTTVKPVAVTRLIKPYSFVALPNGLDTLSEGLSPELAEVLQPKPENRAEPIVERAWMRQGGQDQTPEPAVRPEVMRGHLERPTRPLMPQPLQKR